MYFSHQDGILEPEALSLLGRLFDEVCAQAHPPLDELGRHELAFKLLFHYQTGSTDEDRLLQHCRQERRVISLVDIERGPSPLAQKPSIALPSAC